MRRFRYVFLAAVIMFLSVASTGQAAVSHRDSGTHQKAAQVQAKANAKASRHHRKAKAARHHRKAKAVKHPRKGNGLRAIKASAPIRSNRRMPLVSLSPMPVVSGTTYYVSASGSDSNAGTSPSQAWLTVGRVNRQSLAPGDAVLFAGGQTFADSDLEPATSGTASRSIVFGSFGQGDAVLPKGAWFVHDYLVFDHLRFASTFYGGSAVQGMSNHITVQNCVVSLPAGNQQLGLYANGTAWTIENNVVQNTGLSGMLLNGDGYQVVGNTIDNVGLYAAGYNAHGIYLDASDATITDNTITRFSESAVSARYRSSTIERNYMSGGQIGIDFYQTDADAGTSHWMNNTIKNATVAGLYVSSDGVYSLHESFVIESNAINSTGVLTNFRAVTSGTYTIADNLTI